MLQSHSAYNKVLSFLGLPSFGSIRHESNHNPCNINSTLVFNMTVGELRSELLAWLNSTLQLDYKKLEECGTGAAFCQLFDCIMGQVPMSRVKFGSLSEYESLNNWKILQAQFTRHGITKVIQVERLIKCRLQDNLELLQWFKRFWVDNCSNENYDPILRRRNNLRSISVPVNTPSTPIATQSTRLALSCNTRRPLAGLKTNNCPSSSLASPAPTVKASRGSNSNYQEYEDRIVELEQMSNTLLEENSECKLAVETLSSERNLYFNRLLDIEMFVDSTKHQIQTMTTLPDHIPLLEALNVISSIIGAKCEGFETVCDIEDDRRFVQNLNSCIDGADDASF